MSSSMGHLGHFHGPAAVSARKFVASKTRETVKNSLEAVSEIPTECYVDDWIHSAIKASEEK